MLISSDGGATWSPCGPNGRVSESVDFGLTGQPGQTQSKGGAAYNMSIAVSPVDTNKVALGWRHGPWIGTNTTITFTWEEHGGEGSSSGATGHIHSDTHGLHFDIHDLQGLTLYVCTDGGVAFTRDLCATFDSSINKSLANLQFQSAPSRGFSNGASGASLMTPGLVAGALQDNGVVYSFVDGTQRPWKRISEDEDGIVTVFLNNDLLLWWRDSDLNAHVSKWAGDHFEPEVTVTVRTPSPMVAKGSTLSSPIAEPVFHPTWKNPETKQRMCAIATYQSQELWGLFADPDGKNPFWDFLVTVPLVRGESLSAAGCDDGFTVLAGTSNGNIYRLDVPSKTIFQTQFDPASSLPAGQVYQFSFLGLGAAVARFASGLLLFDPVRFLWTTIGANGLPTNEGELYFTAVDNTTDPDTIYLATDYGVHASWDLGANWLPVSQGLPVHAHPSTLRFISEPRPGGHLLYLFTYGRSAWRAKLS